MNIYRFRNRWRPTEIVTIHASSCGEAQLRLSRNVMYPRDYDLIHQTKEATMPPIDPLIHYRFTGFRYGTRFDVYAANLREAENVLKREHKVNPSNYISEAINDPIPEPTLSISDDGKLLTRTYADGKTEEMPLNPDCWRAPVPTVSGIYVTKEQAVYIRYPQDWNGKHWMFQGNRISDTAVPTGHLTLVHTF